MRSVVPPKAEGSLQAPLVSGPGSQWLCILSHFPVESECVLHVSSHFSRVPLCCAMDCTLPGSSVLLRYGLHPARLLCPWDSPGKNTGVGCHVLQGIFLTQGLNPYLLHLPVLPGRLFATSATWEAHQVLACGSSSAQFSDDFTLGTWGLLSIPLCWYPLASLKHWPSQSGLYSAFSFLPDLSSVKSMTSSFFHLWFSLTSHSLGSPPSSQAVPKVML